MKATSIILLGILLFLGCTQTKQKAQKAIHENKVESEVLIDTTFTFENYEAGKIPDGWTQYYTGKSDTTDWKIVNDGGNKVLAQLSQENVEGHFNEIVYDGFQVKNVELKVRIKGFQGKMDKGGGFVWRFIDANNHYILRENPEEDNVVLYKMENGVRTDLPLVGKGKTYGVDVEPLGLDWNNLSLTVVDDLFTVYLNGKQLFQVKDETFKNAGKVGLWTKADAVSYFDDFHVKSIK